MNKGYLTCNSIINSIIKFLSCKHVLLSRKKWRWYWGQSLRPKEKNHGPRGQSCGPGGRNQETQKITPSPWNIMGFSQLNSGQLRWWGKMRYWTLSWWTENFSDVFWMWDTHDSLKGRMKTVVERITTFLKCPYLNPLNLCMLPYVIKGIL